MPVRNRLATAVMAVLLAASMLADLVVGLTMPPVVPGYDVNFGSSLWPLLPDVFMAGIALLLIVKKPGNPVGWLLGSLVVLFALSGAGMEALYRELYANDLPRAALVPLVLVADALSSVVPAILILLALLFPDGHLPSRRWSPLVWLIVAYTVLGLSSIGDPGLLSDGHRQLANPVGVPGAHGPLIAGGNLGTVLWLGLMVIALATLGLRYRRADADLRHQIKWFLTGVSALVLGIVVASATSASSAWATPPPIIASTIGFAALPASIAIAILKYRLYDIDIVISRTLVYGSLAAFITAVYVAIAVGIGSLIGSGGKPNLPLSILATAIVAVAFQPVRERLQRVANRLVYGRRATPYEVLSEFSGRVAESYAGAEVLPRMARVLAEGAGAEAAEVWLRAGSLLQPAAAWPLSTMARESVPVTGQMLPLMPGAERAVAVRHQGELLGALTVTKRRGESLTPIEEKLVSDLANQAGLVLKNVGLTADLQARLVDLRASRQRLVKAQDDERRKLERNLHDGAQQHLVALKIKLGLAEAQATRDPDSARATLQALKADADQALETLRDLARGIYPPLLADQGLAAALEAQARKATLPVRVDADGVGRYSQEVEAAVYFCCLEALQNVQKYARASRAVVRLRAGGERLSFEVEDDGRGFDRESTVRGAGLTNVQDRLDALGGSMIVESAPQRGTRLAGSLPAVSAAGRTLSEASRPGASR